MCGPGSQWFWGRALCFHFIRGRSTQALISVVTARRVREQGLGDSFPSPLSRAQMLLELRHRSCCPGARPHFRLQLVSLWLFVSSIGTKRLSNIC